MDDRKNVSWLFERHALAQPEAIALVDGGRAIGRAELARDIAAAGEGLRALGVTRGDRVLIWVPMGAPLYVAMLAVQRIGAVAVFLDSWARRGELAYVLVLTQPVAVIADAHAMTQLPELPASCQRVTMDGLASKRVTGPRAAVAPEDHALVTFTTGSSGRPKGADRTHGFLAAQHDALAPHLPYDAADVDLPTFPIFCLNNLASGVRTVLPAVDLADPRPEDGMTLARQMIAERVTTCTLSPSLLRGLVRACRESGIALPALRRVTTGGAPVGADDVRALAEVAPAARLLVLYGSTEVEPIAHVYGDELAARSAGRAGVCVGRIVPGLEARFLAVGTDDDAAPGEPGELIVAGPHVCRAYFRDADATRRGKLTDAAGRVWHRTGDVGYLDAAGRLYLVGRVHNVIRRAGALLYPVDVELELARVPGVRQAAYVGVPDARLGQAAVVAVSVYAGADPTAAIRALGVPVDRIVVLPEIPMDPRHHSKVEYARLKEVIA